MSPLECAETLIFMGLAKIITEDSFDEDGPLAKFRDEFSDRAEDVANAVDVPENDGEQAVVDMARAALQFIDDSRTVEAIVATAAALDAQPVPTQDRMVEPAAVRDAMQHAEKWREFNGDRPAPAAEAGPVVRLESNGAAGVEIVQVYRALPVGQHDVFTRPAAPLSEVVAALAARLATPPDNAAGQEGSP